MRRFGLALILLIGCLLTLPASADLFSSETPSSSSSQPGADSRWFGNRQDSDFLPVEKAFTPYLWRSHDRIFVGMQSAAGYYLYRQQFALKSAVPDVSLGPLSLPAGEAEHDEYMGDVRVFHHRMVFSAPIEGDVSDTSGLEVRLGFQGCARAGLCYPPQQLTRRVDARQPPDEFANIPAPQPAKETAGDKGPPAAPTPDTRAAAPAGSSGDSHFTSLLTNASLPWTLVLFLLAGLGLTFTPCVLPMLPIVTTLVVGQHARRSRALTLSASYALGMAVTYAVLGTLMGLFGAGLNLQARLQSPWLLSIFALLFVLFAAWLAELVRLPRAAASQRFRQGLERLQDRLRYAGLPGAALAGALSTLVVSPCISAPLAGAMVYLSASGNALHGAMALFALGIGMGIPLILVATLGAGWLPHSGAWLGTVRNAFALLLLAVALWLVQRLLPGPLSVLLWGVLALFAGVGLGALRLDTPPGWLRLRQALALVAVTWGIACVLGAARGGDDPLQPLALATPSGTTQSGQPATSPQFTTVTTPAALSQALERARQRGQPALVDIYADWCISCREMERNVFPSPTVAAELAGFQLIRADVTRPSGQRILKEWQLFGPPAMLFFIPEGKQMQELRKLRSQGELDAATLAQLLNTVLTDVRSG